MLKKLNWKKVFLSTFITLLAFASVTIIIASLKKSNELNFEIENKNGNFVEEDLSKSVNEETNAQKHDGQTDTNISENTQKSTDKIYDNDNSVKNNFGENAVESHSKNFVNNVDNFSKWNTNCTPELVIVNKNNEIPENFDLNLVPPSELNAAESVKFVHNSALESLQKMFNSAKKANINLYISSGYRSLAHQQNLFEKKVDYFIKKGFSHKSAEIEAAKIVARPKTSEHNTGLAVDLNGVKDDFYKTKEFKWLMENAADYGFVLRYDKHKVSLTGVIYEPWHFRYVGTTHAKTMKEKDFCLEEYVKYLQNKQ